MQRACYIEKKGGETMEHNSKITLIKRVSILVEQLVNHEISEQDLTMSQGAVLYQLINAPEDKLTLKEIEGILKLSQPVTVGIVKRLEEKGFVTSIYSTEDRRVKIIQITEQGRQKLIASREIMEQIEMDMFEGMSEQEIAQFHQYLLHIKMNIKKLMNSEI